MRWPLLFQEANFQCLWYTRFTAFMHFMETPPTSVASITKLWLNSEEILVKMDVAILASFGTSLGRILSFLQVQNSHDHFFTKHEIYEHSSLRETNVALNVSGTSKFLSRVVASQQKICGKPQVFRELQYRRYCSPWKAYRKLLKMERKFLIHAGQLGYLKNSLAFREHRYSLFLKAWKTWASTDLSWPCDYST